MRLRLLAWVLFLGIGYASGQRRELVANGSFEHRNICAEYRSGCSAEGWFRIPLMAVSNSMGTAGFFMGNHHETVVMERRSRPGIGRSYIYTRLLCQLQKGAAYILKISIRTGDRKFDHTDIFLLNTEPFHFQNRIMQATQQLAVLPEHKLRDGKEGWKDYLLQFTADGTEKYMLIGNLTKGEIKGKEQNGMILYDLDNISLVAADSTLLPCAERNDNEKALYANNHRHTPNRYLDDDEPPVPEPEQQVTVIPANPEAVAPSPAPVITAVNDTLIIPDVLFRFDGSELNELFAYRLDTLVNDIRNRQFQRIEVLGHTDSLGSNAYNFRLSQNRAETVKNYLQKKLNYPAANIITKAFAATLPRASNKTAEGRQQNRRVEIVLIR